MSLYIFFWYFRSNIYIANRETLTKRYWLGPCRVIILPCRRSRMCTLCLFWEGASRCSSCSPGSVSDSEASPLCTNCLAGWYAQGSGNTMCERCSYSQAYMVQKGINRQWASLFEIQKLNSIKKLQTVVSHTCRQSRKSSALSTTEMARNTIWSQSV